MLPGDFWQINLGQLGIILSVLGFVWRLSGYLYALNRFHESLLLEHEILIDDYCDRKGIDKSRLVTRRPVPSPSLWRRTRDGRRR